MQSKYKGFTLIEIILVVALIATITAISIPSLLPILDKNNVNSAVRVIKSSIRTAQTNSRENKNDSTWGVKINNNNIVIFQGETYTNRVVTNDITNYYPSITVTGTSEIIFLKKSGFLTSPQTTTISKNDNSITLSINAKGSINY